MVNSMTGFGVGEAQGDGHIVKVELKSVNHRFCEVRTKLPRFYSSFEEKIKGSITPGKLADLVILSEDIYSVEPACILELQVDLTMVGGKVVYQS